MKIVVTVAILLALALGGYYLYTNNKGVVSLPSYNTSSNDSEESLAQEIDQLQTEDLDDDFSALDQDLKSL